MAESVTYHDYLLCPQAPLVFGDGKPLDFGLGGGSLPFPFPPTLAGAVRAAAETAANRSSDPFASEAKALHLGVVALVRVATDETQSCELLFRPAADAIYFDDSARLVRALSPETSPADTYTDLDDTEDKHRRGASTLNLLHCVGAESDAGKPAKSPEYWTASELQAWLSRDVKADFHAALHGDRGPSVSTRSHVTIDPSTKGSAAGQLFRSTGNDFAARLSANNGVLASKTPPVTPAPVARPALGERVDYRVAAAAPRTTTSPLNKPASAHLGDAFRHEYAIALRTTASTLDGVRRVGGEGRFALVTPVSSLPAGSRFSLPEIPRGINAAASSAEPILIRFILVTPALFEAGWSPSTEPSGTFRCGDQTCRIVAAALPRAQSFSGWGPSGPGLPARIVPAGTVYWIEITAGDPRLLHGESVCAEDHAKDGWGYGFVGVP